MQLPFTRSVRASKRSSCDALRLSTGARTLQLIDTPAAPRCRQFCKSRRNAVVARAQQQGDKDKVASSTADKSAEADSSVKGVPDEPREPRRQKRKADSSDWIASAVTRRFGYSEASQAVLGILHLVCGDLVSKLLAVVHAA